MNKKLTAKIQKLTPVLNEKSNSFSSSLSIEPEERELVLKKGSVYSVFDLTVPVELDVSLINKVIHDVLYDSYYQSESISPIQSLEKAIVNINEKMTSLAAEEQAVKGVKPVTDEKARFNIIAGVLWGNVLYIVQYGGGNSFLMREGDVTSVNSTSEGNFSVASGVVKNDDVIVLCTEAFSDKYPPGKLLGTSLSSNDLEQNQACMILKFIVDTEFTEDEVIDFNLKKDKKMPKVRSMLDNIKSKKSEKENSKKEESIATLADMETGKSAPSPTKNEPANNEPTAKAAPNIKLRKSRDPKFKISSTSLIVVVVVLLLVSLGATIALRNKDGDESQAAQEAQGQSTSLTVPKEFNKKEDSTPIEEETAEETEPEETLPKLVKVDTQPFYDLKLTEETANPKNIVLFSQTLVVTDPASGKIFTSSLSTPKFSALENTFPGIAYPENYDGKLSFKDNEGYKTYNLVENTVDQTFEGSFGVTRRYLGNIYSIEESILKKYVPSDSELTESNWAEAKELENAKAMNIAYSIYILTSDSKLVVYTQGEKADFTITGIDNPLKNPLDIVTKTSFDNIYVADAGNNRVLVLDSKGALVKQIKAEKETEWNNIKSIDVNSDESKLFLLNGSKVFEVDLDTTLAD